MAKTLKQILSTYRPKAKDEQDFADKHEVEVTDDANKNGDEVFKGTKVTPVNRKKERHGYDKGDDEKVYEEYVQEAVKKGTLRDAGSGAMHTVIHSRGNDRLTHTGEGGYEGIIHGRVGGHKIRVLMHGEEESKKDVSDSVKDAHPDLPDDVHKKVVSAIHRSLSEEYEQVDEKLSPSAGAGEYVKDFEKSDAPQFKGKSKEKRRTMGIAAFLQAKKQANEEVVSEDYEVIDEAVDTTLLELYAQLDEENQQIMVQMIDEGRKDELYQFLEVIEE